MERISDIKFSEEEVNYSEKKPPRKKPSPKKKLLKFSIFLAVLAFLAVLVWLLSDFYSKAEIKIIPRGEERQFNREVEINSRASMDLNDKIVPGEFFKDSQKLSREFQTQSREEEGSKAGGTIKVYNKNDPPRSVTLRPETRFLSSEGEKIFRISENLYLPPAQKKEGKLIPSFKEMKVVAEEKGESYNIGPSEFSLPGLSGSVLYYTIWAESEEPMEGGFLRETKIVTEEDIKRAEKALKEELLERSAQSLKRKVPEGFTITKEGLAVEEFKSDCSAEIGQKVDNFICNGEIETKTMAFKSVDLEEIARREVEDKISRDKLFNTRNLNLDYQVKSFIVDSGKMIIDLGIQVLVYDKVTEDKLLNEIKGQKEDKAEFIILENYPGVKEVKIKFSPFWINRLPDSLKRIKLVIEPEA